MVKLSHFNIFSKHGLDIYVTEMGPALRVHFLVKSDQMKAEHLCSGYIRAQALVSRRCVYNDRKTN